MSRDDPILLVDSPIITTKFSTPARRPLEHALSSPSKPVHPFFSPRKATNSITPSRKVVVEPTISPFPSRETQHVRGPQSFNPTPHIPFHRRNSVSRSQALHESFYMQRLLNRSDDNASDFPNYSLAQHHIETIHLPHNTHPIIEDIQADIQEDAPSQLWAEKWRPKRAEHVLCNTQHALYLRDWMKALSLQATAPNELPGQHSQKKQGSRGTKRPLITREVAKKSKRRRVHDLDNDWIVASDIVLPEEEYTGNDGGDYIPHTQPWTSNRFASLSNTILLTGPTGAGKTATVFACAEELGYEVFEVYPGIGRRNGANVDNLIGDVGKNHIVGSNPTGQKSALPKKGPKINAFAALLESKGKERAFDVPIPQSETRESATPPAVRQSLILLEEVDILYKDDVNFWPAVINIIKTCKRPVIMTCNGDTFYRDHVRTMSDLAHS
jgi:hypothetical protein